jgi:hypothetical protein
MTFGEEDVRLLFDALYHDRQNPVIHYDNAVQFHGICLLVYHLGLRPSSIFVTSSQTWFLSWNQVNISVRYMHGRIAGVDVTITVNNFKGYTYRQSLELVFTVRATENENNKMFDLGFVLLAMGMRQGMYPSFCLSPSSSHSMDHCSLGIFVLDWEAVSNPGLDPDNHPNRILVKDQCKMQPIFLAAKGRGLGLDPGVPLQDESARVLFAKYCQRAGLIGPKGEAGGRTLYALRRGTATRWISRFGLVMARKFMAHKFGSSTASDVYDDSMAALDTVASMPGEIDKGDVRDVLSRPHGRTEGQLVVHPKR